MRVFKALKQFLIHPPSLIPHLATALFFFFLSINLSFAQATNPEPGSQTVTNAQNNTTNIFAIVPEKKNSLKVYQQLSREKKELQDGDTLYMMHLKKDIRSILVESNTDWNVEILEGNDWLKIEKKEAENKAILSASNNRAPHQRIGKVKIKSR